VERSRAGRQRQHRQPEKDLRRIVDVNEQRQPSGIGRRQPEERKPHSLTCTAEEQLPGLL
jgi:hypothetical protein